MSVEDDRSAVPLVLLTGPLAPAGSVLALRTALERLGSVLTPALPLTPARPADLSRPALAVLAAVSAANADGAVLCGIGLGAMVALQVAATHPRRVSSLLLCTAVQPASATVRSVHQGMTGVLPARVLQLLPGGRPQAVAALDQVRRPDYLPLTPLVTPPAHVLYGEHDRLNDRASRRLAHALPNATAVAVPGCGPGWLTSQPDRYAEAAARCLRGW
ncbi:alpha/beta fold hydrolase [uncultured Friedmanniella sp.]|uniref:alpha/beta fold hydrolase n=1 Tax=uncultured Friedmanniella sp. TaxID=335381 RepID=UPI0035C9C03F